MPPFPTLTPLTRDEARRIDRLAIEAGVPGIVLMENAAINAAAVILNQLEGLPGTAPAPAPGRGNIHVGVLCGGGNNGGDGYAIARHLHNRGVPVTAFSLVDPDHLQGDAAINYRICRNLGLDLRRVLDDSQLDEAGQEWAGCQVLVDALLGTGFEGEVRPHLARAIDRVNAVERAMVVAIDVPSGLDCQTGLPSRATIRAELTVTFVAPKVGFDHPAARACLGQVVVADIGLPSAFVARARQE